jgi:hypothetical protein
MSSYNLDEYINKTINTIDLNFLDTIKANKNEFLELQVSTLYLIDKIALKLLIKNDERTLLNLICDYMVYYKIPNSQKIDFLISKLFVYRERYLKFLDNNYMDIKKDFYIFNRNRNIPNQFFDDIRNLRNNLKPRFIINKKEHLIR